MGTTNYPIAYQILNAQNTKRLNVVVQFQGIPDLFSAVAVYETVRYGDPRLRYGLPGLVYGGLILNPNFHSILQIDSGLSINQVIEPEQGRGSVATLSLKFVDKDQILTKLVQIGGPLTEPLVNTLVTVNLGFVNSAFPEDYYVVFRGYITNITSGTGWVSLELSDANVKRRQTIFLGGTSSLLNDVDGATQIIPVLDTQAYIEQILGPNGTYDPSVTTYLQIDNEIMTYPATGVVSARPVTIAVTFNIGDYFITATQPPIGVFFGMSAQNAFGIPTDSVVVSVVGNVITLTHTVFFTQLTPVPIIFGGTINVFPRMAPYQRGTTAVAHSPGVQVTNPVQIQGNVIDLALKMMLSGWDGPFVTNQPVTCLGTSLDVFNPQSGAIVLPAGIDAVDVYGISIGDYAIITGSASGNNGMFKITDIQPDLGDNNRMIIVNTAFSVENPANSVNLALRSQYDTFPVSCGVKNSPMDIDVPTHQYLQKLLFSSAIFTNQIYISDTLNGIGCKDEIESVLWLPAGIYTVTRYGRVSVAVTLPPIGGSTLVYLNANNIIEPQNIRIQRATNTRRFYNVIQINYDVEDDGSTYRSQNNFIDETSANPIDMELLLPINADGIRSVFGGAVAVQERGLAILNRYKLAAFELTLKVNFTAASMIEVGDIVGIVDNGTLQISNFLTGVRDLGTQLWEVLQRTLNIKTGEATLTLLSNTGYEINQRYGTISPSSIVVNGSTNNSIEIRDSFGPLFPGNERKKWTQTIGLPIIVHDYLWTQSASAILSGFSPSDPYRMLVSPNLPFVPSPGMIVDIVNYGTGTDPSFISLYKTLYSFIDPSIPVVASTGNDFFDFYVDPASASLFNIGVPILLHDNNYNFISPESNVNSINVSTGQITVQKSLTFTPSSGMEAELIGFADARGATGTSGFPYRIL